LTAKCVDASSTPALRTACPHLPLLRAMLLFAKPCTVFQISLCLFSLTSIFCNCANFNQFIKKSKKSSLYSLNTLSGVTSERCPSSWLCAKAHTIKVATVASCWQRMGDLIGSANVLPLVLSGRFQLTHAHANATTVALIRFIVTSKQVDWKTNMD